MTDHKAFIAEYFQAFTGQEKTPELINRYIADTALAQHILEIEAAFPRYELIVEQMLAEDDLVAVRGVFRGTHRGSFAGIHATENAVSAHLIIIYRIAGGRITEHWLQFDLHSLLEQLQPNR
jgi:predicted ester cyclase